jgi:hypothetical protein
MTNTLKITPRGEITWQVHDTADGRLYLPPTHDEAMNPMEIFSQVDDNRNRHRILGMGCEGAVFDIANHAVKAYVTPFVQNPIWTLRTNVTLTEGMKKIAQPQNSSFEIAGVDIKAAFIPHVEREEELGYRALWIMEKIDSPMTIAEYFRKRERLFGKKINKLRPFPNPSQRIETYDVALRTYGLSFEDIVNDEVDFKDNNLMIATLPSGRQRGKVIKLDEIPKGTNSGFSSY